MGKEVYIEKPEKIVFRNQGKKCVFCVVHYPFLRSVLIGQNIATEVFLLRIKIKPDPMGDNNNKI